MTRRVRIPDSQPSAQLGSAPDVTSRFTSTSSLRTRLRGREHPSLSPIRILRSFCSPKLRSPSTCTMSDIFGAIRPEDARGLAQHSWSPTPSPEVAARSRLQGPGVRLPRLRPECWNAVGSRCLRGCADRAPSSHASTSLVGLSARSPSSADDVYCSDDRRAGAVSFQNFMPRTRPASSTKPVTAPVASRVKRMTPG